MQARPVTYGMNRDDVKKITDLARIKIGDAEMDKLAEELGAILGYVDQVKKISDLSVKNEEILKNIFREDENSHESGIFKDAVLNLAPQREGEYIKVKKIL